jgi:arylformamidase
VIPDFNNVGEVDGSLLTMADQIRRSVAWVYKNAKVFGGDPERLYVSGHSSGGHWAGVLLTTDWQKDFGLSPTLIKGGVCGSGMYDLKPVRLSARGKYIKFTDEMEEQLSSQRLSTRSWRRWRWCTARWRRRNSSVRTATLPPR